jgi:serine/threonine protein kinase/tetratricopeptide (TPR) repeat protein
MRQAARSNIQRLHELFDLVSELPPEERDAEIARATTDAPELVEELRALLGHAARSDSPLDSAAVRLQEATEPPLPQVPGYRIQRRIGRGGSSTVYLADQERAGFTRQVALKVVDRMFDAGSLRSVREEQRILARLEHPGIARLYDAGMTSLGQPWLAMELVDGESVLAHCRSRQLPLRARIELVLSVLDAVAYAHTKGIIHRDLKPANIFVTANGETRLLDFGIAKLSDPADDDETRTLQRALTPAYASPEQMRGDRTTAASDIYSLGVVLYELLTGALPLEFEAKRLAMSDPRGGADPLPASSAFAPTVVSNPSVTVKDAEAARQWRRALRGDIDAVLGKALRPRPEERYASATAMADDLRRMLRGAPVAARRGELGYRTRKFLRRRRMAFAAAAMVLLFAASWQLAGKWRGTNAAHASNEVAIYYDAKPVDAETRRWLRDGADRLARFDGAGARDSFRRAAQSSKGRLPGEALSWDGVARAESALGETGRADEAARRAGALIAGHPEALPRPEAERLRARALAANGDWNAAIPALEGLFGAQPERVDVGLDLVSTLLACGRTGAADTALGRLRQLAPPRPGSTDDGDPRIDLQEAEVALHLSEFQRAAATASRARNGAAAAHAVALGQRAARVHGDAIGSLDRREEARRELASVAARNLTLGLTRETAATQLALGTVLMKVTGTEETRRMLEAALAGCIQAGDRRCEITARVQLARVTGKEGKLTEAIRSAEAALADARRIGDRWTEGFALSQCFVLYNWADDAATTEAVTEPLLTALRESGNRQLLMTTLTNLVIVAIEALDLEKAEAYIVEADGLSRRVGSQLASASIDRSRGYLEQTRGDNDLARKSYTAALDKARRAGVPQAIATYLSDLAWLELADDQPGPAAERAREAIAALLSAGDKRTAVATEAVLAWSEARQGHQAAAMRRLAVLREAARDDGSETARFTLLGIEARVAAAAGNWPRAIELRRQTVRMATEWKARGLVIEQQINLADALRGAGDRRGLEKLVAQMLPEVERNGLRGVAHELRAMLASPAGKN